MKKQILKNMIIHLSLENSIITQFTSFIAVEKRDTNEICSANVPNILEIIAQEDVDFLPYMNWEQKPVGSGVLFSGEPYRMPPFDAVLQDSEAWLDCFTPKRCETEVFQLQFEELPVIQESTSQEVTPQDFGFHDGDITVMKCSRTMLSLPCKSSVMNYCKTASLFGSGLEAGGEADITQKDSLPIPAVPNSDAHLRLCEPPFYCSPQSLSGGMKYDNSVVDHIPNIIVLSSCTSTYSSDKTNAEKQVTHNSPVPQHCKKTKLKPKGRKKMAIGLHNATASEQEFPESAKLLVQRRCFITTEKERSQQKLEFTPVIWEEIFDLQNQDGSWNLSPQLGKILKFDVDYLINHFLIRKGIQSLGTNGKEKLLKLIATLLVLQFIRCAKALQGIVFKSLMKLDNLTTSSGVHWAFESIKKATEWVKRVEGQFASICYRLELGNDWDSATKKILGIECN